MTQLPPKGSAAQSPPLGCTPYHYKHILRRFVALTSCFQKFVCLHQFEDLQNQHSNTSVFSFWFLGVFDKFEHTSRSSRAIRTAKAYPHSLLSYLYHGTPYFIDFPHKSPIFLYNTLSHRHAYRRDPNAHSASVAHYSHPSFPLFLSFTLASVSRHGSYRTLARARIWVTPLCTCCIHARDDGKGGRNCCATIEIAAGCFRCGGWPREHPVGSGSTRRAPAHMNQLQFGFSRSFEPPQRGGFIFIHHTVPEDPKQFRARVFDPAIHTFNPLSDMSVAKARQITHAAYIVASEGKETLTVRGGKRALTRLLAKGIFTRLDDVERWLWKKTFDEDDKISPEQIEVRDTLSDMLLSPDLKRVLCSRANFPFSKNHRIFAKLDPAELGDDECLLLGLLLMSHFKGLVIVPDLGRYGRDVHQNLISQDRLWAGVNFLDELKRKAPELRSAVLSIKEKVGRGALYNDAVEVAHLTGLRPNPHKDDNEFNRQIEEWMMLQA